MHLHVPPPFPCPGPDCSPPTSPDHCNPSRSRCPSSSPPASSAFALVWRGCSWGRLRLAGLVIFWNASPARASRCRSFPAGSGSAGFCQSGCFGFALSRKGLIDFWGLGALLSAFFLGRLEGVDDVVYYFDLFWVAIRNRYLVNCFFAEGGVLRASCSS